ncbi:MAG: hypothetical protein ACKV22_28885 [Bryobacteraceae bacterium]
MVSPPFLLRKGRDIIVKNGHFPLQRAVASKGDRSMAGLQANRVFGVFSAASELRLDSRRW